LKGTSTECCDGGGEQTSLYFLSIYCEYEIKATHECKKSVQFVIQSLSHLVVVLVEPLLYGLPGFEFGLLWRINILILLVPDIWLRFEELAQQIERDEVSCERTLGISVVSSFADSDGCSFGLIVAVV